MYRMQMAAAIAKTRLPSRTPLPSTGGAHLNALGPDTVHLLSVSFVLGLQVSLGLLGLGAQGLHLEQQQLPLSTQDLQLPLGPLQLQAGARGTRRLT